MPTPLFLKLQQLSFSGDRIPNINFNLYIADVKSPKLTSFAPLIYCYSKGLLTATDLEYHLPLAD